MTRGLQARQSDETLREAIAQAVHRRFDDGTITAVEVDAASDFSFDDLRVVEVRIIYDEKMRRIDPADMGGVRRDLFDLLEQSADDRVPLPRFISRSDYFGRAR